MKTILFIGGTRPEAIKLGPLVSEMKKRGRFRTVFCSTGQHKDLWENGLSAFGIEPDYRLDVLSAGDNLADSAGKMIGGLAGVINEVMPDVVLVQGDTTSAFIGALAAFYQQVPVGHVEAGLRTGDIYSPFPEEGNRKMISTIAQWNFAPTHKAADALIKEGCDTSKIYVTGNTAVDAVIALKPATKDSNALDQRRIILVTAHRRENWGEGLQNICSALQKIAGLFNDIKIVFSVHPNPIVKEMVYGQLSNIDNIELISPLDYADFIAMVSQSYLILSDSGGVQEEVPTLNVPLLILRDNTERPEVVEAGAAICVGTSEETIVTAATDLLNNPELYAEMQNKKNPFGDGFTSQRICDILENKLL